MKQRTYSKPKPKLGKKVTYIEVDYKKLEKLVKKVYRARNYDFVAVQVGANDQSYTFTVTGHVEPWQQGTAKLIRAGNIPTYHNYTLFECLCEDGHIEPGEYIVEVCW